MYALVVMQGNGSEVGVEYLARQVAHSHRLKEGVRATVIVRAVVRKLVQPVQLVTQ
jgi:hypothetical protein